MRQYASLDMPKLLYDIPFDAGCLYTIDAFDDNEFLSIVNSDIPDIGSLAVTINDKLDYLDDYYVNAEPLVKIPVPLTVDQTEFYFEAESDMLQTWTDDLLESMFYFMYLSQFISEEYKPDMIKFIKLLKFYITLYVSLCASGFGIDETPHLDKLLLELQKYRPYDEVVSILIRTNKTPIHEGMIDYINFLELDNASYRFIMSITQNFSNSDDGLPFYKRIEEVVMLNERWKYLCM